jgi:ABC-2 type transport system permease protein
MKKLPKIIKIWFMVASRVAQNQMLTSLGGVLFLIGKFARIALFYVFITTILSTTNSLVGYTKEQVVLFFLVFTVIDQMVQLLFRGVYVFKPLVVTGKFDYDLLKPLPTFFRPIFGWTDFLDFLVIVPLWFFFLWYVISNQLFNSLSDFLVFYLLLFNSLLIGFAIHLAVAAIGVLTTEIDNLVMLYRDMTNMARYPTDIYAKGVQYLLTFTIPVVFLITIPAKSLLGLVSIETVGIAFGISAVFIFLSFKLWYFALARYTSASS